MSAILRWLLTQATRGVLGQIIKAVLEGLGVWQFLVAVPIAVSVAVKAMIEGSQAVSVALMLVAAAAVVVLLHYVRLSYETIREKYFGGGVVQERTPITDLRDWAVAAGWDADIFSSVIGGNDFWTFKTRLEQVAVDSGIEFWGRKYRYGIPEDIKDSERLIKIDPRHFEEFELDVQEIAQSKNYDILTHKPGIDLGQSRDMCFRDLHINAAQARAWLKREGKAPPAASFNVQLVAGPGQIGDYNCVFAIIVKNIESNELKNCLVQMEQISITHPDQMPMPLVLRTDGQIRNSRKGRFTLSPNQPKSVPVLFRNRTRNNEWFFVDEAGHSYFTPAQHSKLVLGIYGGKFSGKALIDVLVGDDWLGYPSLKIVPDDFVLSETEDSG